MPDANVEKFQHFVAKMQLKRSVPSSNHIYGIDRWRHLGRYRTVCCEVGSLNKRTKPIPPPRSKAEHLSDTVTSCSAACGNVLCMQWAPPKARTVPRIFDRLVRLRPAQAWLLILFCTDAVVLVDLLTGPDLWWGPLYLLVMCVAAWSLGWRAGQFVGIACMGLTFALNGLSLYPHGQADFASNFLMRFGAISLVIAVIAGVRRAYVREWWLARTDILTGALNRQAFFELAQSAIDTHRWRLLVYADLDGLKKVNDVQGHAAGDACLQAFGFAVRTMIRHDDIFARLGGDEFAIFMSVKDEAAARAVAARLHKAMNCIPAKSGNLSCSVGGLTVPPGRASIDDLVRSADNLMYDAKLRGACLKVGVASNVDRPTSPRARVTSRGVRALVGNSRIDDRRERVVSFASEVVPR